MSEPDGEKEIAQKKVEEGEIPPAPPRVTKTGVGEYQIHWERNYPVLRMEEELEEALRVELNVAT